MGEHMQPKCIGRGGHSIGVNQAMPHKCMDPPSQLELKLAHRRSPSAMDLGSGRQTTFVGGHGGRLEGQD